MTRPRAKDIADIDVTDANLLEAFQLRGRIIVGLTRQLYLAQKRERNAQAELRRARRRQTAKEEQR